MSAEASKGLGKLAVRAVETLLVMIGIMVAYLALKVTFSW